MTNQNVEIDVVKDENYRTVVVNGLYGGARPGFLEAIIYTQEVDPVRALESAGPDLLKIRIRRTLQSRLVIDPIEAKRILFWFTRHVSDYEKKFGKIELPEERIKPETDSQPST